MTPILLRYIAMLSVALAMSGLGAQVIGKKHSEEDAVAEDHGADIEVLTADTFTERADSGLPLMVYYYTKWCKHCVTTGPMIEALAAVLRDRDDLALQLAKVDVEAEMELAKNQGVNGFPTIRMYRDGRHDDFHGERSVPNLVQWLERKMGLGVNALGSSDEVRQTLAAHPVVIVGFFQDVDSAGAAVFKAASGVLDKTEFALVNDEKLLTEFGAEDGTVAVFKKFDEGRVDLHLAHSVNTLVTELKRAARPLVTDFRSEDAQEYFTAAGNGNRPFMLVAFLSRRAGHFELLHDMLLAAALERVNKVSFLSVNVDDANNAPAMAAFSLTNATAMPAMRMYSFATGLRYKPTTDRLSADAVRDFIAGVQSGALTPSGADEAVEAKDGVKVLTSATFDQVVYDGRRHALVLFYTETCQHCVSFKPVFEEVASQVAEEPSLTMAKIDMARYRPKSTGVDIVGVPYVVMYPRCAKEKPVVYDGTRSSKTLLKFIKKHTGLEVQKPRSAKREAGKVREEL